MCRFVNDALHIRESGYKKASLTAKALPKESDLGLSGIANYLPRDEVGTAAGPMTPMLERLNTDASGRNLDCNAAHFVLSCEHRRKFTN